MVRWLVRSGYDWLRCRSDWCALPWTCPDCSSLHRTRVGARSICEGPRCALVAADRWCVLSVGHRVLVGGIGDPSAALLWMRSSGLDLHLTGGRCQLHPRPFDRPSESQSELAFIWSNLARVPVPSVCPMRFRSLIRSIPAWRPRSSDLRGSVDRPRPRPFDGTRRPSSDGLTIHGGAKPH